MIFTGYFGTVIEYNDVELRYEQVERFKVQYLFRWEARKVGDNNIETFAFCRAPKTSLLGSHIWYISNDSRKCSLESSYSRQLTFSGCQEDEFRRRSDTIISLSYLMNNVDNVDKCGQKK